MSLFLFKELTLKLTTNHFTYLGLMKLNFMNKMNKLKSNIRCWNLLNLFNNYSDPSSQDFYSSPRTLLSIHFCLLLNNWIQSSCFMSFVRAGKSPRISKAHEERDVEGNCFGFPVFKHYYWAANAKTHFLAVGFPWR